MSAPDPAPCDTCLIEALHTAVPNSDLASTRWRSLRSAWTT